MPVSVKTGVRSGPSVNGVYFVSTGPAEWSCTWGTGPARGPSQSQHMDGLLHPGFPAWTGAIRWLEQIMVCSSRREISAPTLEEL